MGDKTSFDSSNGTRGTTVFANEEMHAIFFAEISVWGFASFTDHIFSNVVADDSFDFFLCEKSVGVFVIFTDHIFRNLVADDSLVLFGLEATADGKAVFRVEGAGGT